MSQQFSIVKVQDVNVNMIQVSDVDTNDESLNTKITRIVIDKYDADSATYDIYTDTYDVDTGKVKYESYDTDATLYILTSSM